MLVFDNPELKTLSRYVRSYLGGLKTLRVEVDKQEWKYLEGGRGETVLFLHGGVGSKTQWRSIMQEYLQDYRVIAIDVPGLYVNQGFRFKKHSLRQYGVWLSKVLDQLRLDKVHLVGASMGSTIAAYFSAQYPDKVASVMLLGFPNMLLSRDPNDSEAIGRFFDVSQYETVEDLQTAYNRAYFKAPSIPGIVLRYNLREFRKYHQTLQVVLNELIESRPILIASLRKIKVPTLIMHGIEDQVSQAQGPEFWQRQIPQSIYHELPECGHMIHIEKPEDVGRLHKELLHNAHRLSKQIQSEQEDTGRFAILD